MTFGRTGRRGDLARNSDRAFRQDSHRFSGSSFSVTLAQPEDHAPSITIASTRRSRTSSSTGPLKPHTKFSLLTPRPSHTKIVQGSESSPTREVPFGAFRYQHPCQVLRRTGHLCPYRTPHAYLRRHCARSLEPGHTPRFPYRLPLLRVLHPDRRQRNPP